MQGELPSQRITEGVIWKQLLFFFFPILLGSFFQQMYNTVDTIIVGRFVGTRALAAVGSTSALLNLMNGFFIGLSTGATVLLSQFYGAKSKQGVQDTLHTGVALSLVLGAVVMTLGYSLGPKILGLMNTPESCMDDAVLYIKIYFAGAIASMLYNMGAGILRAMGDSRRPTMFLMAACGVNIVLDILCVVVLKLGGGRHCDGFLSGGQRGDGHGGPAPPAGRNTALSEKDPLSGRAAETHPLRWRPGGTAIRDI